MLVMLLGMRAAFSNRLSSSAVGVGLRRSCFIVVVARNDHRACPPSWNRRLLLLLRV